MTNPNVLVPVRDSRTLRNTVGFIVNYMRELPVEHQYSIHFLYPLSRRLTAGERADDAWELLNRIENWAQEDLGDEATNIETHTAVVGGDEYLFNPRDYAEVIFRYADANDLNKVFIDPAFNPVGITPLLPRLEAELERHGLEVEITPVERPVRRFPLARQAGIGQFVVLFAWSFGFYLLISDALSSFNLVTGTISALIVAGALWRISVKGTVNLKRLLGRLGRMVLYIPLLLWEITKANISVAYVVLSPEMPIDPGMVEFDAAVWSELPVTTLANSITLTPGTLTVNVTRQHFTVHTLTKGSKDDLLDGRLERAVRFVFYGRSAARIASPAERLEMDNDEIDGQNEGDQS